MTSTSERRRHPRFNARLPLRLKVVGSIVERDPWPLFTKDLSKMGLSFPSPQRIEPGKSIEVEVTLLGAGPGGNNVYISALGRIIRAEFAKKPGWYELAAYFGESPSGAEPEWQKMAAMFDKKT